MSKNTQFRIVAIQVGRNAGDELGQEHTEDRSYCQCVHSLTGQRVYGCSLRY